MPAPSLPICLPHPSRSACLAPVAHQSESAKTNVASPVSPNPFILSSPNPSHPLSQNLLLSRLSPLLALCPSCSPTATQSYHLSQCSFPFALLPSWFSSLLLPPLPLQPPISLLSLSLVLLPLRPLLSLFLCRSCSSTLSVLCTIPSTPLLLLYPLCSLHYSLWPSCSSTSLLSLSLVSYLSRFPVSAPLSFLLLGLS